MTTTEIVKIISSVVAFVLLSLLQSVFNAKKNRRITQLPMPVVSVVYSLLAACVLLHEYSKIENFIQNLAQSDILQQLHLSNYLTEGVILIVNLILILGFILIKLVLRPIITKVCGKEKVLEAFSLDFYEYDAEYDEWFLKKKWRDYRKILCAIVWAANIACGVYLGLTIAFDPSPYTWYVTFPACAVIVLAEIYSYVNGQTKEEFEHSVGGEVSLSQRIGNYFKLREIYEHILPEPLMSAKTGSEFVAHQTPADYIKTLSESKDIRDRTVAEYFDSDGRYKRAELDGVLATRQMMFRKNVVFFNPFYRDLSMYITLPLVNTLLSGRKTVVICGRKASADDVKKWISEVLKDYTRMSSLWRVNELSDTEPRCEVGVITFPQLYDKRIIATNLEYFHATDFVLLVEPSAMLDTGQVALSIIASEMHSEERPPVYCICDRNVDGLVDTMSHLLHTELTHVVAMPVPRCNYSALSWDADGDYDRQRLFDKQIRYLGNGLELAAIAVKNQVPKVTWYSETKSPVRDIRWIAGQYYATICRYMNLPAQQKSLYEKIEFVSNLWNLPIAKEQFIIAEDEFCNIFSSLRAYMARGSASAFVNILSENYLLRDYMRCNQQMFTSDPNAIPSLVPDYAKTERNTILKLIIMMTYRSVTEAEILDEFKLVGIETTDALGKMTELLRKYTTADDSVFTVHGVKANVDELTSMTSCVYSVSEENFERFFLQSLRNAYYIVEHENLEEEYIDARLFSHISQKHLPGQFVTYDGKYYQVKYISPQSGVVLRRASDLYDGRKYYRQIRTYCFETQEQDEIVSCRTVMDVEITAVRKSFSVKTDGYLDMSDYHDLRSARLVDLGNDPSIDNLKRSYRNKTVLRVRFPDMDVKLRFTVCLLLSEVFRSVFPNSYPYLAVVTSQPDDIEGMLNYVVYKTDGSIEDDYVYIIEDSDLDLGLLSAVERNFMSLIQIIADFAEWHIGKMREPATKDPIPTKKTLAQIQRQEEKKRSLFVRMAERIRKLFGGKKEDPVDLDKEPKDESSDTAVEAPQGETEIPSSTENSDYSLDDQEITEAPANNKDTEVTADAPEYSLDEEDGSQSTGKIGEESTIPTPEGTVSDAKTKRMEFVVEEMSEEDSDILDVDGTDIFDNDGMPENPFDTEYFESQFTAMGILPITQTRYQRDCYLKYGFKEVDGRIQVDEIHRYLRVRGFCNNDLTKARKRETLSEMQEELSAENHCDFCGLPLNGVCYDKLNDGRVRCNDCTASAISSIEDFKELFVRCLSLMEDFYNIRYRVPVTVQMSDAKTVAKGAGCVFRPTSGVTPRVLGFARRRGNKYSLLIENGSPRLAAIDTMVHEMTHIWQYLYWDDREIQQIYQMNSKGCSKIANDIVYEGMAMWSSIQYLYQIGETYYASMQEAAAAARDDVYGIGFRLYREKYQLMKDSSILRYTPFNNYPPLEPEDVLQAVRKQCAEEHCIC